MNPYLSNISGECVVDFQRAKQLLGVKERTSFMWISTVDINSATISTRSLNARQ